MCMSIENKSHQEIFFPFQTCCYGLLTFISEFKTSTDKKKKKKLKAWVIKSEFHKEAISYITQISHYIPSLLPIPPQTLIQLRAQGEGNGWAVYDYSRGRGVSSQIPEPISPFNFICLKMSTHQPTAGECVCVCVCVWGGADNLPPVDDFNLNHRIEVCAEYCSGWTKRW